MKFYYLMLAGKINISLFLILLCTGVNAQLSTYSPYSRFGIGTLNERATASQTGVARGTAVWTDMYSINPENPATYSLAKKSTFQLDGSYQSLNLSENGKTETAQLAGLNSINLLFKRDQGKAGFGLGLNKFSNSGYVTEDVQNLENIGDVIYRYRGDGGIYRAHVGFSYVPVHIKRRYGLLEKIDTTSTIRDKDNMRHIISFGVNLEYYFGEVENISETEFEDLSFFNTRVTSAQYVSDFTFNFGMQGHLNLSEKYSKGGIYQKRTDLLFGATYSIGKDLGTDFDEITENYTGSFVESILDTVSFVNGERGTFYLPTNIGIGLGLKLTNVKGNAHFFLANYSSRAWSQYAVSYGDTQQESDGFQNENNYSVAYQFSPSYDSNKNLAQQLEYRIGYRYSNTYLNVNGKSIDETAISAGVTIPLRRSASYSRIYLGTEFGLRGTDEMNLVEERFTNINLGISFAPNYAWFQKQKYN